MLLADRGYDGDWIRTPRGREARMGQHPATVQSGRTDLLRSVSLRARNLVERFFNKIKHCRRAATRHDKLAANYLAFVQFASIRLWLCVKEFAS
jgi:transposase